MTFQATNFATIAIMLLAGALSGCTVLGIDSGCADVTDVEITLTGTANGVPRFVWPNDCRADELVVREQASGATMWSVEASSRQISSPVAYGTVPPGTSERQSALSLGGGETYYVELYYELDGLYSVRGTFTAPD